MIGFAHSRLVARLRAIASLPQAGADLVAALPITVQNLPAGRTIVSDGQETDQCCILVDGFLFRHKIGPEGKRQIVSWHVPGDIPDLYSLHLHPMDHNITTLGPAVVGFIKHEPFRAMLAGSPNLTDIFWRETLVDSAAFREWVVSLGKRGALARIAHMLCELFSRLEVVGLVKNNSFQFPASQADLADATGMTPVHANRMIQQLRTTGLIEWEGATITIRDLARLKDVGEFDDSYLHFRKK